MTENKRIQFIIRFVLAVTAGLAITGVGLNVMWINAAGHAPELQGYTRKRIGFVNDDIKAYRKKTGKLPASLDVIGIITGGVPTNDANNPMMFDAWLRPLVYKIKGNKYALISYGRDGKPGGIGLDCDFLSAICIQPRPKPLFYKLSQIPGHTTWSKQAFFPAF